MKRISLLLFFSAIVFTSLLAQSNASGTISGKLIDKKTKETVIQANILVLQQKDSTMVTGKVSDKNGSFSIPVKNGNYIVHISFIGYRDVFKNVAITQANRSVDLGTIELSDDDILLSETVVTAKAPEIVVKGDTVEYNADSYKVTESAVVEDLLKKMPGVEVDSEGKITVNGREVKKIMVDGEEFFSSDPKVASKNLPAKMVNKLQILDRKSDFSQMTGFDDGDEETIINLTVKSGMKEGLFGNAFAGYGSKDRYEGNAMVNYMKNKDQFTFLGGINNTNNAGFSDISSSMFGGMGGGRRGGGMGFGGQNGISKSANTGLNFSKQFASNFKLGGNVRYGLTDNDVTSKTYTENILQSGNTYETENSFGNNYSQNVNMELRMEWDIDTLTKVMFRPSASLYKNRRSETTDFNTTRIDGDTINSGNSNYFSDGTGNNLNGSLEVSRKLNSKGRVLSVQLGGGSNSSENEGDNLSNTYYSGGNADIIDQRFVNKNSGNNWNGMVSYVEPIGKNNFIQLAYSYRNNYSESDKDTRTKDAAGNYTVLDSTYSKRLENDFENHRAELNFRSMREKYDYTVGFSVQPSKSTSKTFIGTDLIDDYS